jgi:hypothetical protein
MNYFRNSNKWIIPFTYKLENDNDTKLVWINYTQASIVVPLENNNQHKWLLGNLNFMGYFRVNYDRENWLKIIDQLKRNHLVFSATERAALIFDSFTFARLLINFRKIFFFNPIDCLKFFKLRVGYVDYSIALDLASYLINEEDYVPWK